MPPAKKTAKADPSPLDVAGAAYKQSFVEVEEAKANVAAADKLLADAQAALKLADTRRYALAEAVMAAATA